MEERRCKSPSRLREELFLLQHRRQVLGKPLTPEFEGVFDRTPRTELFRKSGGSLVLARGETSLLIESMAISSAVVAPEPVQEP